MYNSQIIVKQFEEYEMLRRLFDQLMRTESSEKDEKKEIKQEVIKPNYFEKLPDVILKHNLFELTDSKKTAVAFTETSKRHHQLFQSQIDLPRFIHHVAHGEQDQAEAILKKFHDLNDEKALNLMLTKKMDVTDIAGKKFKNISAFQYALWALDSHMWTMLKGYMPEDMQTSQLMELEEKGVNYTKPAFGDKKEEHITSEKHFDFSPLIVALKDYIDNFDTRNWDQREAAWCKNVGGAQRNVPAHVADEYCRIDRALYPVPDFKEATLPRGRDFYNYVTRSNASWFSDPGLGSNFAVLGRVGNGRQGASGWLACSVRQCVVADLAAITALCKMRTNELEILKDRLLTKAVTPVSLRGC
jgi:hypothetical protein